MSVPPRRLLESPDEVSPENRNLVAYLEAVPEPSALPPEAVERISRRVRGAPLPSPIRKWAPWGLLVVAPLAIAAAWSLRDVGQRASEEARPLRSPNPPQPLPAAPVEALEEVPPAAAEEAPEQAPVVAPEHPSKVHPSPRPVRAASSVRSAPALAAAPVQVAEAPIPPAEPPDPLIEESRLLQSALHQLRTLKDGEAALEVLDTYEQRFPQGQLRAEATLARVDSLLLLDRPADALDRLQRLSPAERARLPRSRALGVLEGELLAEVGRCDEATSLLRRLPAGDPLLDERALFVEATCEARAGRVDPARALFEELLRRWPDGAHASQARRALGKAP